MQPRVPNGSVGSNNPYYDQGESSNPFHSEETQNHKAKGRRYYYNRKRKPTINEEFKPKTL